MRKCTTVHFSCLVSLQNSRKQTDGCGALTVSLQFSQSDLLIVGILGTLGGATAQLEATREQEEIKG